MLEQSVFLEGFHNREGSLPLIVQKFLMGGYNYATTDLAALRYRIEIRESIFTSLMLGKQATLLRCFRWHDGQDGFQMMLINPCTLVWCKAKVAEIKKRALGKQGTTGFCLMADRVPVLI